MLQKAQILNPTEAARRLGVSAKALRLYEKHGLVKPMRSWPRAGAPTVRRRWRACIKCWR